MAVVTFLLLAPIIPQRGRSPDGFSLRPGAIFVDVEGYELEEEINEALNQEIDAEIPSYTEVEYMVSSEDIETEVANVEIFFSNLMLDTPRTIHLNEFAVDIAFSGNLLNRLIRFDLTGWGARTLRGRARSAAS